MSFAQAKQLARDAGLIPSEDEEYQNLLDNMRYDVDWFKTMGLHDPRKNDKACAHPLEVDNDTALVDDERKYDDFTERYQQSMGAMTKARRFWRDYEFVYDSEHDTYILEDMIQEVNGVNVNAPGYFRWTGLDGSPMSSLDFASNPVRTKRQIAGFIMGILGHGYSIGIIQTGIVRNNGIATPYYTVFISQTIAKTRLMAENAYALALRVIDVEHLEKESKALTDKEFELNVARKELRELRKECLDPEPVEAAKAAVGRLVRLIKALRTNYSERVGRAYQAAEIADEPIPTMATEIEYGKGIDYKIVNIEVDDSRDEIEVDEEFLEREDAIIQRTLAPARTGYARDIQF